MTVEDIRKLGLFEQFLKQSDLIGSYATELYAAFHDQNATELETVDSNLVQYLRTVDPASDVRPWRIDTVSNWLESISVMGIAHGFVPGITRLQLTPNILGKDFLAGPTKLVFNFHDYSVTSLLMCTLSGTQPGYTVFSATRCQSQTKTVRNIIGKYQKQSEILKQAYYEQVREVPNYSDIGFILNDGITDTIDARQLTIAAYL